MKRLILGATLPLFAAGQAQAFCDEGILETDVLCLTEEVQEIKVCRTTHPETQGDVLTLYVDPAVSEGPMVSVVEEIPFAMFPGTGGYPWDNYSFTFFHEGGRATLNLRRSIDAVDNDDVEISLELFGRGARPQRTLSCMVPALRAEVDTLLASRGIEMNNARTGPSADSKPYYTPLQPLPGDTPYGGYTCRSVELAISDEGTDGKQVALYAAPIEGAAIMDYAYPSDVSEVFECWAEGGFSGIVWPDMEKRGEGDPWSMFDFDTRMAACGLDEANWPPNMPYFGKCSSAWVKSSNVVGLGP